MSRIRTESGDLAIYETNYRINIENNETGSYQFYRERLQETVLCTCVENLFIQCRGEINSAAQLY